MARLIVAILALGAPAAQAAEAQKIQVLSNRAEEISAGDALVAIEPAGAHVTLGDRDVTDAFALRENGRHKGSSKASSARSTGSAP